MHALQKGLRMRIKNEGGLGRRVGGAVTGGVAVVLVVDGVVQQDGHEGAAVGRVPPRHSELLVHLLQLQQLKRGGR